MKSVWSVGVLGVLAVGLLGACDAGSPNDVVEKQDQQRLRELMPGPTELPPGLSADLPASVTAAMTEPATEPTTRSVAKEN